MHRRSFLWTLPGLASGPVLAHPAPAPAFATLAQEVAAKYPDVDSAVVVRGGQVLFEHYRAGSDADALRDVQSVTKSVLSLAVGAALGSGALRSLDQPVAELLSEPQADLAGLTVRHLLTSTSGFAPMARWSRGQGDDPAFLLGRERVAPPGSAFAYDNLAANLLSIVLERAVGMPVAAFAGQRLFAPLGIARFEWAEGTHRHSLGFSGLSLRTRDMARLGELMLGGGQWQGAALVPPAYVQESVTAHHRGGPPVGLPYGYLWWVTAAPPDRRTYFASGFGGQLIWVHPPLDLAIATTARVSADSNARGQAMTLVRNELFRAAAATRPDA